MKRKTKTLLLLLVLALVCVMVWLTRDELFPDSVRSDTRFVADHAYDGRIVVGVIERMTGPEKYFEFLIDLNRGEISQSEKTKIEVHSSPRGRIDDCLREGSVALPDGNGQNMLVCGTETGKDSVTVFNKQSNAQVRHWLADKGWKICGLS